MAAYVTEDLWQTEGVNDRVQLSRMNAELNRRILEGWMREGVTVLDPATTWVHASVDLAPDVTLLPGTSLEGATSVGAGRDDRPGHHADRRRGRGGRDRDPDARAVERHRGRRECRPVRVSPAGHPARRAGQDRHLRGDQERPDRGGRQGAAPELCRRRGDRRRGQHRGRRDLRQLRRGHQGPHDGRGLQLRRQQLGAGRPGDDRRRRVRGRRVDDHRRRRSGRARGGPRPATQHRRLGGPQAGGHQDGAGGRGRAGPAPGRRDQHEINGGEHR